MHDPIEGRFRVVGEQALRPSERQPWKTVLDIIQFVVTVVVFVGIMVPVAWVALILARAVFPSGPM